MSWYRTGTIAVTNGSATVAGTGTAFIANVNAGDALHGPDGNLYEITGVVSDTSLSITPAYLGTTATGQSFAIQPTRGVIADLLSAVQSNNTGVTTMLGGPGAGKFPDGTLAQPGMRFTADEDTGLRRVASNDVALVAGGADKLRVTGNAASGDAVQSGATDATAGRLMTVGAFGLGALTPPTLANLDDFNTRTGVYKCDNSTVLGTLPPVSTIADTVLVLRPGASQISQIYSVPNDGRTYIRKSNGTVSWGAWQEFYTSANLLGTVSQSAGVPTGAVIERGSNANGEYVRFADGTQICRFRINAVAITTAHAASGLYYASVFAWTFPAAFVTDANAGGPFVTGRINFWTGLGINVANFGMTTLAASCYAWAATSNTSDVQMFAVGRWI